MLEEYNPWWKGEEYIEKDEDFRKWKESKIKWVPRIIEEIGVKPYSLHFVFGPRQVGKTTLLKLLVKRLLEEITPKAIFYFRCDQLADFKELDEIIREYLKIKEAEKIKTSFILLDEVTFPREWYRAIKWHVDMGNFKDDVLVLTGSLSMFAKREIETFPGRRGGGKDFVMYPLSFREFIGIVNKEVFENIGEIKTLRKEEIRKACLKSLPWLDELNKIFESYLRCGGFPLAVKSLLERNEVSTGVIDTYLSWIKGDIAKLRRNESIMKRILKAVIEKVPSTVSFHGIAKEFEIKSHKTVFYYIDTLEKLFLLKILYYIDPNKGIEVFHKQRKMHITDPFLYQVFSFWCFTKKPGDPVMVESIVASHLARRYKVGYWKDKREIDIAAFGDEILGIEVKYKKKPKITMLKVGKIKSVIALTKEEFNEEPLAVPVSVFLGCLNV